MSSVCFHRSCSRDNFYSVILSKYILGILIDRNRVGLSLYELSRILDTRIQFQVREYRRRFHAFLSQSKDTDNTIARKIQERGGGGRAVILDTVRYKFINMYKQ